jgi:hypothetical protein
MYQKPINLFSINYWTGSDLCEEHSMQHIPCRDLMNVLKLSIRSQWYGVNCNLGIGGNVSNTIRLARLRNSFNRVHIVCRICDSSVFWNNKQQLSKVKWD